MVACSVEYRPDPMTNDDYDSPWKDAVERHFPEFMAFYFPAAHAEIDWSRGYDFLDKELQQVVQDGELGRRYVDKLVRVTLLSGAEDWVFIHIEIQGTKEADFAKRMFVYNYRLYDRYDRSIASLAVLADDHPDWKPSSFEFNTLGCRHLLEFPTVKLLDWAEREDHLFALENPFALLTAAHLLTRATRSDMPARYTAKWKLIRLLYERDWERQRILDLFGVIDWMMRLPADLEQQLWQNIEELEKGAKMQYVTSVERIGIEKGRAEGEARGEARGEAKALIRLAEKQFGPLPADLRVRVLAADTVAIEAWLDRLMEASSLEALFSATN